MLIECYSLDPAGVEHIELESLLYWQQFYLNVIHLEGHALQEAFDKKTLMATDTAGVGGAGGQGHVGLRS